MGVSKKKYSPKVLKKIVELYKVESYTVAEVCLKVGISDRSYYYYQSTYAEFAEAIEKAKEEFTDQMLVECKKSLVKLIKGYDYEEKKTLSVAGKDGKPSIKEQNITKKHMAPNLGAIIHYQTNRDPGEWKNRQTSELTGKDGKDLFASLTDEELDKRIEELEKKLTK